MDSFYRLAKDKIKGISKKKFSTKVLITFMIAIGVVVLSITAVQGYFDGFGYVVLVDDEEVGFIYEYDKEDINSFVEYLTVNASDSYEMSVMLNETVDFLRERRPGEHKDIGIIKDELRQMFSFSVYGYILTLDGKETVTLGSEADFNEVVNLVKNTYVEDKENTVLKNFVIEQEIDYIRKPVDPEEINFVEEAANLLIIGKPQRQIHLVSRGESLYVIAKENNISVSELKEANPQLEGDIIRPEDELNLLVSQPMVNVTVVEEITVTERIPFDTTYVKDNSMYTFQTKVKTQGKTGEKEVVYSITKENGLEVEREVVEETINEEPVTRVVAQGTIRAPDYATGRFIWPLATSGTISSRFGPRWGRMHYGVDIAAPRGTAIRAADSGVVRTSGRQGGYGNLVVLEHSGGYTTYYAHNSRNLVSVGQRVEKGDTIALVGSTGNSTGNHVHFEIRKGGTPINPLNYFTRR